jgi:single-strand DNA-binding protein
MSVNKVILIGNLGRDPESRQTNGGGVVVTLSLATSERRKDREGNWTDHTEWHRVVAFGKTAENLAKYCKKGKQVFIEGRLSTRKWQDKDGQDRWTTEIVADQVRFLGGGRGESDDGGSAEGGGYTGGGHGGGQGGADDDIPF